MGMLNSPDVLCAPEMKAIRLRTAGSDGYRHPPRPAQAFRISPGLKILFLEFWWGGGVPHAGRGSLRPTHGVQIQRFHWGARRPLQQGLIFLLPLVSSSVFALHFTEPPISAQLLAFLRVFCMTEGKSFQEKKKCCVFFFF